MRLLVLLSLITVGCVWPSQVFCQQSLSDKCSLAERLVKSGRATEASILLRTVLVQPIHDTLRARAYAQYGLCLKTLNNLDSGIYFLKQAAIIWQNRGDKKCLYTVTLDMASLLSIKTDYREPMKFYRDALAASSSANDSLKVYIRMCALLLQKERFDSAYQIVQQNISTYPDANGEVVPYKTYYTELTRGFFFNEREQPEMALRHLKKAALAPVPDKRYTLNVFALLADTYCELEDYDKAFQFADSANALAEVYGWAENRLQVYKLYAYLYEVTGNIKKALDYTRLSQALSDSFYTAQENASLTEMAEKYKNEKIVAEKAVAEKDRDIMQRNWAFTAVALLLAAALAVLFLRNAQTRKKANRMLTQQKQQVQQLADQLAVANDTKARLFSTIGHDLRGPVSTLYASLKMQELKGQTEGSRMSGQTVQLLDTLEDLLAWSKSQMDGFKVQEVNVNVPLLLRDLSEFYATTATAKHVLLTTETTDKVAVRTDENILKTILRNAIGNAIANTAAEGEIVLHTGRQADGQIFISVSNPCDEESFLRFQASYKQSSVNSGVNGLGTVLIKEFAQKIGAAVHLRYDKGNAVFCLSFSA